MKERKREIDGEDGGRKGEKDDEIERERERLNVFLYLWVKLLYNSN